MVTVNIKMGSELRFTSQMSSSLFMIQIPTNFQLHTNDWIDYTLISLPTDRMIGAMSMCMRMNTGHLLDACAGPIGMMKKIVVFEETANCRNAGTIDWDAAEF